MTVKREHMMGSFMPPSGGWLSKLAAGLTLVAAVVAGVALSAFFFGFFLVLAAVMGLWILWQQWRIKRHLRRHAQQAETYYRVIQGEYKVVDDAEQDQSKSRSRRSPRH